MFVSKRNGRSEPVHFDKVTARIRKLCYELDDRFIEPAEVAQKVIIGMYNGVTTTELDNLAAETAASLTPKHPDYAVLAARVAVSNLQKNTDKVFSNVIEKLYRYVDPKTNNNAPLIADDVYEIIMKNRDLFDSSIVYDRDYNYDYFGFKTLERSYLLRINGKVVERPQHMLMRVAIGIHKEDIDGAIETYNMMGEKLFTHATPTLFNSGTPSPQLSSCFLIHTKDDSIEGIYDTLKTCALISKSAGGIGFSIHDIRAKGSYIRGTNGTSNGIVPMLRVFNTTARYVDQGGGKRKGSFAAYLEPWHADVFEFLDMRKNTGSEEMRARDLFYALWVPDLFMERVEKAGMWSLMCPSECPGLSDVYGEEFNKLYTKYEKEGKMRKMIPAQELWFAILDAQTETGTPYILYKDACNQKSNQKNLGTIKSSNLCTEIIEYTCPDEVAVCNLASLALPMYIEGATPRPGARASSPCMNNFNSSSTSSSPAFVPIRPRSPTSSLPTFALDQFFDHQKLFKAVQVVTKNLNKVIDVNMYPVPQAKKSNLRHRPIGLGVQGLADLFVKLRLPFESDEAQKLNAEIFETIYFGALTASMELAKQHGPYETFPGSPSSQGILQFDMWGVTPTDRWDWTSLKRDIIKYGLRNSLLVAPMPTASTAQILGFNECFEPFTSNIYTRRVLSGEYVVVNHHLLKDLCDLGIWNSDLKDKLIRNNGSVQGIAEIPAHIQELYKTVWEIKQKTLIDMAAARGAFIDQSQSLNIFIAEPNFAKLTSMHFYAWKKGLKTGMYYLRSRPAANAIQFTVDQSKPKTPMAATPPKEKDAKADRMAEMVCSLSDPESCLMCSG